MPNQRKKSKVYLSGYYEKGLKDELRRLAKAEGVSLSKLVESILEAGVKNYYRHHRKPNSES